MKKTAFLLIILLFSLYSVNVIWAASWYVDPVDGDDSVLPPINDSDNPWETIKRALDHCSSGDIIELMDGDFVEAIRDTSFSGSGDWDDNNTWWLQIAVNKSNVTIRKYSGNQSKPSIIGYDPDDDDLNYVMRIDETDVKIQNVIFDGLYVHPGIGDIYVETNDNVFMTPDADRAEITYCEFTNFGNDEWSGGTYDFYAIIAGGWINQTNTLDDINIMYNTFYDNPFEGRGAHEIYISRTSDAEIEYNHIIANGEGQPIKLKDQCSNTEVIGNTVHGAANCFFYDEKADGTYSSGTIFRGNTFGDSLSVIDVYDIYEKPFRPLATHISVFEDNSIYEMPTADSRYIQGLTYKSSATDLYAAHKNSSHTEAFVLSNPNAPNPANKYGFSADNYYCQGDMCTASNHVIFCAQNSAGAQRAYKDSIDGDWDNGANPSDTLSVGQNETVTAMASYNSSTFLTAIRDTGNSEVRIYQSTVSDLKDSQKLNKSFAFADSITAIACYSTDIVFAAYKNGTSKIYKGTLNNLNNATQQGSNISGYVTAMCFARGYLVTAVYNSSPVQSKLYYGTSSNPTSSYTSSYSYKMFISLAGDYGTGADDYLYSLVHDTSGGTNSKKIYFTKDVTDYDDQLYFYSQWYRYF